MSAVWELRSSCSLRPCSPVSGRGWELGRFSQSGWLLFHDLLLPSPGQENCSFYILSNSSLESGIAMKANPSLSQSPGPGPGPGTEAGELGAQREKVRRRSRAISRAAFVRDPGTHSLQFTASVPGAQKHFTEAFVFTSIKPQAIIIIGFSAAFTYCHPLYTRHLLYRHRRKTSSHIPNYICYY